MLVKRPGMIWLGILTVIIICLGWKFLSGGSKEKLQTYDLNSDGVMENYHLAQGKLMIRQPDVIDWSSPDDWDIRSFAIDDVTGDGLNELIILLWKPGSFGLHKPLGHDEQDDKFSCHLFIYQLRNGQLMPRWCSSALDQPIKAFSIKNFEQKKILTVEEGYLSYYLCQRPLYFGSKTSRWEWNEWGFYSLD